MTVTQSEHRQSGDDQSGIEQSEDDGRGAGRAVADRATDRAADRAGNANSDAHLLRLCLDLQLDDQMIREATARSASPPTCAQRLEVPSAALLIGSDSMIAVVSHRDELLSASKPPGPLAIDARTAKEELRAAIRAERRTRSDEECRRAARGLRDVFLDLPQLRRASRVAVYVSLHGEPGTRLLRAALAARGVCVLLPVLAASGELHWLPDSIASADRWNDRCHVRRRGSVRPPEDIEILLVPALAVDTRGRRLGRGGDGYDRIMRRLGPTSLVLGAVHDCEVLDAAVEAVPEEPYDVPVDAVLTPTRVLFLPRW
jgi:5-formyltetrahydrofolate cyclo-ligase